MADQTKVLSFKEKLHQLQISVAVGKLKENKHGKFNYRSATDIIEATRELRKELRILITPKEEVEHIGDRFYVRVALLVEDLDSDEKKEVVGWAREPEKAAMMSESQTTGSSSSYAEKSALEHLFLLSDSDRIDPDSSIDGGSQDPSPELTEIWGAGSAIAETGDKEALKAWFETLGDKKNILGAANWKSLQGACRGIAKNGTKN